MAEAVERAEYGVAVIAGMRVPVVDPVNQSSLARFQPKITFGDYTRDSDDLISVWVQSSWLGGGQAFKVNAESQNERWWDSTLDTEQSGMISLRLKVYEQPPPAGVTGTFYPLGEYAGNFYGCWNTSLCVYDDGGALWEVAVDGSDVPISLHAVPVERGQVFDGKFYIPLGGSGLDVFDISDGSVSLLADDTPTNIQAKSATIWDDKLAVLTMQNEYRLWNDTEWTAISRAYTVHDGSTARKLVTFLDKQGEPTVYVVTSRGLWGVDPINNKLVKGGYDYPPHPTQGYSATVWRNTDMYIVVGVGVHQWNTDIFTPMGLDRNEGLPARLRGSIVDLYPEYNGMMALVRGQTGTDDYGNLVVDPGQNNDAPPLFPAQRAISSYWRFNGFGWHKVWESSDASGNPTWSCLAASESGSRYGLFWGYGGKALWQPQRISFYNPQQGVRAGIDHFQPSGYHRTGRWNANMPSWPKLASHIDVNLLEGHSGTVLIEYQTEQSLPNEWTLLGSLSHSVRLETTEQHRFYFGENFVTDIPDKEPVEYPVPAGIVFDWIELRYTFTGIEGNDTTTPLVDSFVMKFVKMPLQTDSWTFEIPIDFDEQMYDVGPTEMEEFLRALPTETAFVPLVYKDRTYRVLIAQTGGTLFSGDNPHARTTLICLEVK